MKISTCRAPRQPMWRGDCLHLCFLEEESGAGESGGLASVAQLASGLEPGPLGPALSVTHVRRGFLGSEPCRCAGQLRGGTLGHPVVGECRATAPGSPWEPMVRGLQVGDAGFLEEGLLLGVWAPGPGRALGAMGPGVADRPVGHRDARHGPVPARPQRDHRHHRRRQLLLHLHLPR